MPGLWEGGGGTVADHRVKGGKRRFGWGYAAPALLFFLGLIGCVSTHRMAAAFDPSDFEPYRKEGTAVLEGKAFLRMRYRIQPAWEEEVVLTPANAYSAELIEANRDSPARIENLDPRLEKCQRRTRTDRAGRFRFDRLPAGEYLVHCFVEYPTPTGLGPLARAGAYGRALAWAKVRVAEGEEVSLEVARSLPGQY